MEVSEEIKKLHDHIEAVSKIAADGKLDERMQALEAWQAAQKSKVVIPVAEEKALIASAFFKALYQGKAPGGNSETAADGGYTIPVDLQPEVFARTYQFGKLRPKSTVIPTVSNVVDFNVLNADFLVYWPGEGTAPSVSKPTLTQDLRAVKKLMALGRITSELDMDSPQFGRFMLDRATKAVAREEDRVLLVGNTGATPADPFMGILYSTNTGNTALGTGDTTFAKVTLDDFLDMTASVDENMLGGAEFGMHRTIMNVLRKSLSTTTNQYVYQGPTATTPATLWGWPVSLYDQLPSTSTSVQTGVPFAFFGNLAESLYIYNNMALAVDYSTDAYFSTDEKAMRIRTRVAYNVAPKAGNIAKLTAA